MTAPHERTAIVRADFFLALAERCRPEERTEFEAFLEAAIVFARAALHRMKNEFESHPLWMTWFAQLKGNPAAEFFREHRDFVLKETSPKIGQSISFNPVATAAQLYYFEKPSITAAATVREHLRSYAKTLQEAEACFRK